MTGDEPHDVRLVYLACAWLVAHRGHFLSDLSKENIDVVNNFPIVYKGLMDHFTGNDFDMPWECDASTFLGVLNMKTAEQVKMQVRRVVENTAAAFGASVDVVLTDDFPALTNDASLTHLMAAEARKLLGDENVVLFENPSMGADDFAYFSNAAKGCYFNIGTTAPGQPPQMLHSAFFAPDENCMITGLALFSAGVWKLLEEQA